ncbi:hypothetical protein [Streptomyces sp. NPDC018972]|uniref:hypothetical protein n=1 Tax=Streptomyces sp. NPDC018972 TaxID=3365060 RepID=UPI0037ACCE39
MPHHQGTTRTDATDDGTSGCDGHSRGRNTHGLWVADNNVIPTASDPQRAHALDLGTQIGEGYGLPQPSCVLQDVPDGVGQTGRIEVRRAEGCRRFAW